jgi:hypothetical protein
MSEPSEQLVFTFFETPVLAVRSADGTIYLSLFDLCTTTNLNLSSQRRRIRADEELHDGLRRFRALTAGGVQEIDFLLLEYVPAWLSTVNRTKAAPAAKERLRYLRIFIIREVYDSIARTAGLPTGSSRNIESLEDLQRFDEAVTGIDERQRALEESLDKARQAWKDHEERIRQLEAQLAQAATIGIGQRGIIYQLVQAWAQARVEREEIPFGNAIAGCWAVLKKRYGIAKYEHLPMAKYEDCIAFIKRSYQTLTSEELTGDQLSLPDINAE